MNSIDGVLARIQEILTRIHEIQAKDGRVQGFGPKAAPSSHQPFSAPRATGRNSKALSATKTAQFQQLLNDALSAGAGTSSGSGTGGLTSSELGKLGNVGNLESILGGTVNNGLGSAGASPGSSGPGAALAAGGLAASGFGTSGAASAGLGSAGSLEQYRGELLKALQELAAQRQKKQSQ